MNKIWNYLATVGRKLLGMEERGVAAITHPLTKIVDELEDYAEAQLTKARLAREAAAKATADAAAATANIVTAKQQSSAIGSIFKAA